MTQPHKWQNAFPRIVLIYPKNNMSTQCALTHKNHKLYWLSIYSLTCICGIFPVPHPPHIWSSIPRQKLYSLACLWMNHIFAVPQKKIARVQHHITHITSTTNHSFAQSRHRVRVDDCAACVCAYIAHTYAQQQVVGVDFMGTNLWRVTIEIHIAVEENGWRRGRGGRRLRRRRSLLSNVSCRPHHYRYSATTTLYSSIYPKPHTSHTRPVRLYFVGFSFMIFIIADLSLYIYIYIYKWLSGLIRASIHLSV